MKNSIQSYTVAYLGPKGTFSEKAAKKYFQKESVILIPLKNIADIFQVVEDGTVDYGIVPIENSLDGSIYITLDLLLSSEVMVYGEVYLRIIHNLIAKKDMKLSHIKQVYSHTQALAQCRKFLEETLPSAELKAVSSTARAVEIIQDIKYAAAIGTDSIAKNLHMKILKSNIEDHQNNFTRFFILHKKDSTPSGMDKTSLIFSTNHVPGSLYKCFQVFAVRNINLTKIESRPMKGTPWEYIFYLDFEGHRLDKESNEALKDLRERCLFLKILGSYAKKIEI